jgi:predicted homoserine dehydrogenase-like protein
MFGINDRIRRYSAEHGPIRTSVIGTGAMGGALVDQLTMARGMEADVIVDIDLERAAEVLAAAGFGADEISRCSSPGEAEEALARGRKVITTRAEIAWSLPQIDCVVEATGNPTVFADIALATIAAKKHIVTFNVEGDVLVGNILKKKADHAGVVYTGVHGDEPGVVKALYDEADALGFEILAAGRHDYGGGDVKWNKENVGAYLKGVSAGAVQRNAALFASFVDGSKTNEECCMIANATGLEPDVRGMHGPAVTFNDFAQRVPRLLDTHENGGILGRTGVVERIMPAEGAHVQPVWCFVVVRIKNELQRVFMNSMSGLGSLVDEKSPLGGFAGGQPTSATDRKSTVGIFYTPYHYVAIQAPISIAMAVIDRQASIAPLTTGKRYADVMALTKKDLAEGEIIDEIGGLCVAGRVEKARVVKEGNFLPFALARGARTTRAVPKGEYLTYDDVALSSGNERLVALRREQDVLFPPA